MATDPRTFLAANVLNDGKIVSYRALSREMKVHNNVAKKMLYDFHQTQCSKKPGSTHATYLLDGVPTMAKGTQANGQDQSREDVHMQSSPFLSSSMPQLEHGMDETSQRSVLLAREEDVEGKMSTRSVNLVYECDQAMLTADNLVPEAKARFERLHSIHIYSLGPSFVQNLQILSECNREISVRYIGEDPLVAGKQYGIHQNNGVRRRTGRRPPYSAPAAQVAASTVGPRGKSQESSKQDPKSSSPFDRPLSSGKARKATTQLESKTEPRFARAKEADKKATAKPANLKREQSDLFKSFSKPRAKFNKEDTGSSAGDSPVPVTEHSQETKNSQEYDIMEDASEDEQEDDFAETNKIDSKAAKSQRAEREDRLRKMMDDEDEDMEDPAEALPEVSQESESIDAPISQKEASPEPLAAVSGGRRRGRRKVMKRKTIKDDEGFLVTREEPAWESFSEDDPPPQKEKTPASTASSSAKSKKSGGKPGQGNIKSFFGKR